MATTPSAPRFFRSRKAFRAWLERHHASARELWIGFYKKASGKKGLTYPEAVEEALCFGWIDGIKKRVDDTSFTHRFTPRLRSSIWSAANIKRIAALKKAGLMAPAGLTAFRARTRERSRVYLFEQKPRDLDPDSARRFQEDPGAWTFFQAQPPGYRRLIVGWIVMAKRDETRLKRLAQVISASAVGTRVRWM